MQPATVLGSTRATVKHQSFIGQRLVIVQPTGVDDAPDGPPLIALDILGCRKGDQVMLTSESAYAREITKHDDSPARWSVIGLIDEREPS
ncbi:Ethanolamine utilization protein EutN [Novipirellula galeiformis]|uniref:Ethanolamine utilization protein EutN n=1 Tax=Novipirellula galeiformis TaxID=2528004 RepID=A0A5C6C2D3_9BACT|nr:EutN/CcmL family microcompartment protein [Novipirellula galeiformis]TWU17676.1 Ethanolamine utilization protein EutN [Novipirellula galeiformis]